MHREELRKRHEAKQALLQAVFYKQPVNCFPARLSYFDGGGKMTVSLR